MLDSIDVSPLLCYGRRRRPLKALIHAVLQALFFFVTFYGRKLCFAELRVRGCVYIAGPCTLSAVSPTSQEMALSELLFGISVGHTILAGSEPLWSHESLKLHCNMLSWGHNRTFANFGAPAPCVLHGATHLRKLDEILLNVQYPCTHHYLVHALPSPLDTDTKNNVQLTK